jgi:NitT/TauT family transport system permease protein
MSNSAATAGNAALAAVATGSRSSRALKASGNGLVNFFAGLLILFALWWLAIYVATLNPAASQWAAFGPIPAFKAIGKMWQSGLIPTALWTSGYRLGAGLLIAIVIGVPIGILIGRSKRFRELSNSPFQLMRMISPLSWEPIAVIVFAGWDQAIVFLIAVASVWPVMFSTAAGLSKVDPAWFKVARNLGAKPWHVVTEIILPAITFDVLTGIRLAVGVAWVVLVPAEFLGVTSGFGYTIEDARESLEYDHLMAMIIVIGAVGYVLDTGLTMLIKHFSWHRG